MDHCSLKHLLDQRLSTDPQHTWVRKLFGYTFSVIYKPGRRMRQWMPCVAATRTRTVHTRSRCPHPSSPSSTTSKRKPTRSKTLSTSAEKSRTARPVLPGTRWTGSSCTVAACLFLRRRRCCHNYLARRTARDMRAPRRCSIDSAPPTTRTLAASSATTSRAATSVNATSRNTFTLPDFYNLSTFRARCGRI